MASSNTYVARALQERQTGSKLAVCDARQCDARHKRDLDVLVLVAKVIATRRDQARMLCEVLALLEQQRGMLHCTIMLLDPDGKELRLEVESTGATEATGTTPSYRRGEGVTGRVLESGETIIVPLVAHEPRFQYRVHRRPSGSQRDVSFICVPIQQDSAVIGTLSADLAALDSQRLQETAQLLNIVASLVANDAAARRLARSERERLELENQNLRSQLQDRFRPANMVGDSAEMQAVFARVHQVAPSDTTVLIRGESGTGKELIAAAIHFHSRRNGKPLVKVNCSALNESLLESELFGHEKGAFTGALYKRLGRFEEAEGGTLFLDELGEFSPAIQVKLLRAIQERAFERVGSSKTQTADVRIVAATNRNLEQAVREGEFREDLYYRVNVFPIMLPPLREHRSDIPSLANHFAEKYAGRIGHPVHRIGTPALNLLMGYAWPGNIRELENCIEHAVLLCTDGVIDARHLPPTVHSPTVAERPARGALRHQVSMLERELVADALKRHGGNVDAAARDLGITGRMVRYKIERLGVEHARASKRTNRR